MNKLKQYFSGAFVFLSGAVGHHYVSKLLEHKSELAEIQNQDERDAMAKETLARVKELQEHFISNNIESSLNETLENANVSDETKAQAQITKDTFIEAKNSCFEYIQYLVNKPSVSQELAKKMDAMAHNCFTKITNTTHELSKLKVFVDKEKNKFLSGLTELNEYLNSLSLLELSGLYHILTSLLILITAFNILSVFFSNEIIKFFNLESKYPKLAKFFELRRVFQKYYLLWNISILFITCVATILIDMLIFY